MNVNIDEIKKEIKRIESLKSPLGKLSRLLSLRAKYKNYPEQYEEINKIIKKIIEDYKPEIQKYIKRRVREGRFLVIRREYDLLREMGVDPGINEKDIQQGYFKEIISALGGYTSEEPGYGIVGTSKWLGVEVSKDTVIRAYKKLVEEGEKRKEDGIGYFNTLKEAVEFFRIPLPKNLRERVASAYEKGWFDRGKSSIEKRKRVAKSIRNLGLF